MARHATHKRRNRTWTYLTVDKQCVVGPRSLTLFCNPSHRVTPHVFAAATTFFPAFFGQVLLSLVSSHNAIYRMVHGFRPLLEEFQVWLTMKATNACIAFERGKTQDQGI